MKKTVILKIKRFSVLGIIFVMIICVGTSQGQEIKIIEKKADGTYKIEIAGQEFSALNRQHLLKVKNQIDSLIIELKAANQRIKADSSLISTLDRTVIVYNNNIALKDTLLSEVSDLYIGYRNLYFDYKRIFGEPWLNFSGGIGALRERGGDNDILPVILLGMSIKRVSLWGFINNEQSGFIFGLNYPIRFNLSLF